MTDALFPPPEAPASLYAGDVMHARLRPFGARRSTHRFSYKVTSLLVDLDRLAELPRLSRLISHNRFNLFSVHDLDLGAADGTSPRGHAERLFAEAGLDLAGGRLMVLTYPRVLGFVFNPLSVYWRYDEAGALRGVIYEVRNTFGERHSYVAPVRQGELGPEGLKQEREKLLYVSPFLPMRLRYHFRLRPPGEAVTLRIVETDDEGPILAATFKGRRRAVTSATLAATFLRYPLLTVKIVAAIHWEAARLWIKGARLEPRPAPPRRASWRSARSEGA